MTARKTRKWAFDSEIVMHERPSGIDNTICTYGNLIKFKRGKPLEGLKLRQQVNIPIVDTGVSRTMAKLVAGVADLKNRHPGMLDSIGHLVETAIGVSHPTLERIFRLAEESGFSAKLTGAGGGSCALVFLPQDY
ncbi:LOW QUALITY PROTEIN: mevalonate kinase-like, partial [Culex quinquefasciatus]|uniref:LOW QUALITY PROTEIN: mevalonate kinase-like n=1 Tax=Culex quinquefasciatus TaxID=7176 RepID=UPI0018E3A029